MPGGANPQRSEAAHPRSGTVHVPFALSVRFRTALVLIPRSSSRRCGSASRACGSWRLSWNASPPVAQARRWETATSSGHSRITRCVTGTTEVVHNSRRRKTSRLPRPRVHTALATTKGRLAVPRGSARNRNKMFSVIIYWSMAASAPLSPASANPGMMSPASSFSFDNRPASSSASKSGRSRSVSRPNSSRNFFVVT